MHDSLSVSQAYLFIFGEIVITSWYPVAF